MMKPFHIITALFAGGILSVYLFPLTESWRIAILISLVAMYLILLIYGASVIGSQFFVSTLCRGNPEEKYVAITFDDGPCGERSLEILEILQKFSCTATFFLTGKMAGVFPEVVRQIALKGHQIGNHSYSHSNFFPLFRSSRIRKEIRETNQVLKKAGAGPISFFRPPFGVTNPNIARGLKNTGLKVAGWSIRSFDTRNEPAEKVVRRILDRIREGDVILLHETSRNILQILEQLLPEIGEKGLQCVSLDQLFGHRPTD